MSKENKKAIINTTESIPLEKSHLTNSSTTKNEAEPDYDIPEFTSGGSDDDDSSSEE